jgi:sugar phosphate isomerase/epimerase
MKKSQVAAQCYTIRDFCKDAATFAESMKKVKAIGYAAVQISGVGPIPEDEIVRIVKGEGLTICATHENGKVILEEVNKVIDRLGKLGTKYTAYPHPHQPIANLADAKALAKGLDVAGEAMRKAGQVLTYHNHAVEWKKFEGRTIIDVLYDETDPRNLQGEIDTYWVQAGGGDPVAWCQRLNHRLPLLHLKDYGVHDDGKGGRICEIGNGNLDFKRICAAAAQAGCEWYIVEQDTCPGDPFDSLKQSYSYITANLVDG